jgi:ankyrin repeat protein
MASSSTSSPSNVRPPNSWLDLSAKPDIPLQNTQGSIKRIIEQVEEERAIALDLSGNRLGTQKTLKLVTQFRSNNTLISLNLSGNDLRQQDVKTIYQILFAKSPDPSILPGGKGGIPLPNCTLVYLAIDGMIYKPKFRKSIHDESKQEKKILKCITCIEQNLNIKFLEYLESLSPQCFLKDPDSRDTKWPKKFIYFNMPLIHIAASTGNLTALQKLIEKNPLMINLLDKSGRTPLQLSIENHHIETAEYLIKNGANPNFSLPNTPLHLALYQHSYKQRVALLELILTTVNQHNNPLIVDAHNSTRNPPLLEAIRIHFSTGIKMLLEKGAKINGFRDSKIDPIYYTLKLWSEKISTKGIYPLINRYFRHASTPQKPVVIKSDASGTSEDASGTSEDTSSTEEDDVSNEKYSKSLENDLSKKGNPQVMQSIDEAFIKILTVLLEPLSPDSLDSIREDVGLTPLHFAVNMKNFAALQLMLVKCPNVNCQLPMESIRQSSGTLPVDTQNGFTLLHCAVQKADLDIVKLLTHYPSGPADKTIKEARGMTPLDLAKELKDRYSGPDPLAFQERMNTIIEMLVDADQPNLIHAPTLNMGLPSSEYTIILEALSQITSSSSSSSSSTPSKAESADKFLRSIIPLIATLTPLSTESNDQLEGINQSVNELGISVDHERITSLLELIDRTTEEINVLATNDGLNALIEEAASKAPPAMVDTLIVKVGNLSFEKVEHLLNLAIQSGHVKTIEYLMYLGANLYGESFFKRNVESRQLAESLRSDVQELKVELTRRIENLEATHRDFERKTEEKMRELSKVLNMELRQKIQSFFHKPYEGDYYKAFYNSFCFIMASEFEGMRTALSHWTVAANPTSYEALQFVEALAAAAPFPGTSLAASALTLIPKKLSQKAMINRICAIARSFPLPEHTQNFIQTLCYHLMDILQHQIVLLDRKNAGDSYKVDEEAMRQLSKAIFSRIVLYLFTQDSELPDDPLNNSSVNLSEKARTIALSVILPKGSKFAQIEYLKENPCVNCGITILPTRREFSSFQRAKAQMRATKGKIQKLPMYLSRRKHTDTPISHLGEGFNRKLLTDNGFFCKAPVKVGATYYEPKGCRPEDYPPLILTEEDFSLIQALTHNEGGLLTVSNRPNIETIRLTRSYRELCFEQTPITDTIPRSEPPPPPLPTIPNIDQNRLYEEQIRDLRQLVDSLRGEILQLRGTSSSSHEESNKSTSKMIMNSEELARRIEDGAQTMISIHNIKKKIKKLPRSAEIDKERKYQKIVTLIGDLNTSGEQKAALTKTLHDAYTPSDSRLTASSI